MPSSHDKVIAGTSFRPSASVQNALIDGLTSGVLSGPQHQRQSPRKRGLEIWVRHTADIAPAQPVGFGNAVLQASNSSEALEYPIVDYAAPAAGDWGIAQEGILKDAAGPVLRVGFGWVNATITNNDHTHVDWDGAKLASSTGYAEIIWREATPTPPATAWCLVLIGASAVSNCATLKESFGFNEAVGEGLIEDQTSWFPIFFRDGSSSLCGIMRLIACGETITPPP